MLRTASIGPAAALIRQPAVLEEMICLASTTILPYPWRERAPAAAILFYLSKPACRRRRSLDREKGPIGKSVTTRKAI